MKHFISSLSVINANTPPCEGRVSSRKILSLLLILFLSIGNVWGAEYQLVKSSTDLVAGCHYVIGATYSGTTYFMATTSNNNNRKLTSATVTNEKVTLTSDIMTFTLGGSNNAWTFKTDNYGGTAGYLNATSTTGSNYLKIVATDDQYNKFTISVDANGVATITCNGKTSRHIMYLNGTTCFACYNNQTQASYVKPSLYKEVTSEPSTPAKTYDVTWMVNGEEWDTSEDVEENTQITTLPTEPTDECAGKVFQGWTDREITDGQKPAILFKDKSPEITEELTTFYAVFATESTAGGGGTTTETLKGSDVSYTGTSGYVNFTAQTTSGTWSGKGNYNTQEYIQINKNSKNYYIGSPVFTSNVKSIKFTTTNNSLANRTFYICSSNSTPEPTSGDLGSHKTTTANESFTIDLTTETKQFYIYSSGAVYISQIDVILGGGATISDYTTSCSGSTEPVFSLTDEQLRWSAATATALKGATDNLFPNLTNTIPVPVTYGSSNTSVATIDATTGAITLVASGTTTISAAFAGGEVSGTKYAAKTVTYTLTVKQLVSCADIYNLADEATFVLKDFVVTYVNGKYTYIKDGTGYGLIYKESYGLNAGDQVVSGKFEGKRASYNGLVEIIPTTEVGDLGATSGTAPEPDVMTNTPTNADINKYVKFENVTFASTAFSSKKVTGKINAGNITFYDQFATNATFNTSKKYDVIGAVSIYNSTIQVNFISAEEVAEPTLNVKITDADFGKVAINGSHERTLTLNGSLLTKPVSLAIEGEYFTLASESVTPEDGKIDEAKIKIYYQPTVEGIHTATLKITSDDVAGQTITLTGQAVQQHTVHFFVNGEEQNDLAKKVLSGNTLEELPTATSCDLLNYPTFAGWASAEIVGTTDLKPTMLDQSTPITSDCNYYAVFEKGTTSSGSTTSAIMKYTGGTTTNMKDGNNATIVGLDETLFNITSTKTASGTHVGLNKNNDIRLYANKSDGNGNILTISMLDGSSITKITLDIKQEATFVVKANGKSITGADNVYTIDNPSCSIQNTTTGATTQLHLNSITIEYSTSTTTYEYITSCAVVVPTCEITYDYADGEGECTTDIVEQDTEYTLCATAPTKAGHTFLNWKDQNGVEYAKGATINSITEDLTLTAQWQVNSYEVTWMSLGEEIIVNSASYNTQPTKPATDPDYTCRTGKEFVGWTTQEIDGVGVPANLYTDDFPVVTEAITYYAVFASKIEGGGSMSKAVSLTNGETIYLATESGIGVTGAVAEGKDATVSTTQGDWIPFTVVTNGLQYQFKNGDNYITAAAKSFKITETPSDFAFENGYIVYNVPSGSDAGDYVLLYNSNSGSFYRFYKKSNIGKANYETFYVYKNPTHIDYTTSCPEPVALGEGDNSEIISAGGTIDVKVNRNFVANTLYTLSLPFAMDNVEDIFGAGTILYKYSSLTMVGGELEIGFDKVNSIEAGTPYLIEPAQAVDGFKAEDVTITNTQTPITFTADGNTLTMKPVLTATTGAKTNGEYWLASDRYLYNTQTNLLSLRAVFELNVPEASPVPRARVVFNQNTATGMENVDASAQPVKTIINGQLFILRGEKMYDAQGKLVK